MKEDKNRQMVFLEMAKDDLKKSYSYANELIKRNMDHNNTLMELHEDRTIFEALVTAMVVSYCRSFSDGRGKNYIAKNKKVFHDMIVDNYRNYFYAHSDIDKVELFIRSDDGSCLVINEPTWTREKIEDMFDLISLSIKEIDKAIDKHYQSIRDGQAS